MEAVPRDDVEDQRTAVAFPSLEPLVVLSFCTTTRCHRYGSIHVTEEDIDTLQRVLTTLQINDPPLSRPLLLLLRTPRDGSPPSR